MTQHDQPQLGTACTRTFRKEWHPLSWTLWKGGGGTLLSPKMWSGRLHMPWHMATGQGQLCAEVCQTLQDPDNILSSFSSIKRFARMIWGIMILHKPNLLAAPRAKQNKTDSWPTLGIGHIGEVASPNELGRDRSCFFLFLTGQLAYNLIALMTCAHASGTKVWGPPIHRLYTAMFHTCLNGPFFGLD